jgi:hypothetical protein
VILGKIVGESKEGNVYSMRGVVKADNITKKLAFSGQMIKKETVLVVPTIEQQKPLAEIEIKSKPILFVKQSHRTDWQEEYTLTARVFDANKNPKPEFYDNFGFLPGVDIFVNITHELGIPLTTFEGQTDEKGYFHKQYHITENLVRTGKYFVHVVADNGITNDSKDLVTFIFSETAKGNSSGP